MVSRSRTVQAVATRSLAERRQAGRNKTYAGFTLAPCRRGRFPTYRTRRRHRFPSRRGRTFAALPRRIPAGGWRSGIFFFENRAPVLTEHLPNLVREILLAIETKGVLQRGDTDDGVKDAGNLFVQRIEMSDEWQLALLFEPNNRDARIVLGTAPSHDFGNQVAAGGVRTTPRREEFPDAQSRD